METLIGIFLFFIFISIALKVSLLVLKILFVILGFVFLFSFLPFIAIPVTAIIGSGILILRILFIPFIIIGGFIMLLKLIF
ncbi:MAG: hypothetical protein H0S78_04240 [Tissierellales bacterium]|nr:hypothetical protein [Tissierellales bacterium]HCX04607.1 hypothetical protein [Clostridiales bacterium]